MSSLVPKKYYEVEDAPSPVDFEQYLYAAIDGAVGDAWDNKIVTLDFLTKRVGLIGLARIPIEIKKDHDRLLVNIAEVVTSIPLTWGASSAITKIATLLAAAILGVDTLPIAATVAIGAVAGVGALIIYNKFLDMGGQELIDSITGSYTREILYEEKGRSLKGVIYDELPTSDDVRDALIDMTNHSSAVPGGTLKLLTSGKLTEEYSLISAKAAADISASLGATTTEFQTWNWAKRADGTEASNNQLVIEDNDRNLAIVSTSGELAIKIPGWWSRAEGTINATVSLAGLIDGGPLRGHTNDGQEIILGIKGDNLEYLTATDSGGAVIIGGAGTDIITGSSGNDRLVGDSIKDLSGFDSFGTGDTIYGKGGNDEIYGGAGSDTIDGGDGEDVIFGGIGNDTIHGGADKDIIFADSNVNHSAVQFALRDKLYGDGGDDTLNGSNDGDDLYGGADDDTLFGAGGADKLDGGTGNDELFGSASKYEDDGAVDSLIGGDGFDTYHAGALDVIEDSDGKGRVFVKGDELQGGTEQGGDDGSPTHSSDDEKVYKDQAGNSYHKTASGLTIDLASGGTLTIKDWHDGDLGITLKPRDPSGGGGTPGESPQSNGSPLIIDLDGDGVEVSQLRQHSVFFDVDSDGIRERTAWVSADDGLLVLDHNGNGKIDDASELFGYGRTVSVTFGNATDIHPETGIDREWASGFDQLAQLDSNKDGIVDNSDSAFSSLRVWRDLNQDGTSSANELFSLADVGIKSIDLKSSKVLERDGSNLTTDRGAAHFTDGTTHNVDDVWFGFDQQSTQYDHPTLDAETAHLPTLAGMGALKDLRTASVEDPVLKALLSDLAALSPDKLASASSTVEQILWRWAGAQDENANSRGAYADARHLSVYEALFDTEFRQFTGPNPRPFAGAQIEEDYQLYLRNATARLLLQTDVGKTLFPELSVDDGKYLTLAPNTSSQTMLARLAADAPTGDAFEKIGYWHTALLVLDCVYASFADVKAAADGGGSFRSAVASLLAAQGVDLTYEETVNALVGSAGNDQFQTKSVNYGLSYTGTTVVVGGEGNDELHLGGNKQVVYWGAGQGSDTVVGTPFTYHEWSFEPHLTLRLVGLNADDVVISRGSEALSNDIVITIKSTGETLTLRDAINESSLQNTIIFGDGTSTSVISAGSSGADLTLAATSGDDRLEDFAGTNHLDGGAGNDILVGRDGDDVYVFGRGSGKDLVDDSRGLSDAIAFGADITPDDLELSRRGANGQDLVIRISGTSDELVITDQFAYSTPVVEQFHFADGSVLDAETLASALAGIPDSSGRVLGFAGGDELDVSGPGTVFDGLGGSDTYWVVDESGSYKIADSGKDNGNDADIVRFAGVRLADVEISRTDADTFVFRLASGAEITIDNHNGRIEGFVFADQSLGFPAMLSEIIQREHLAGATEITGSSGQDTLEGTSGNDIIDGNGGDDTILGLDGDDVIKGGYDNDVIDGGAGYDRINASDGNDDIRGGTGNDVIVDTYGNTVLRFDLGDGHDIVLNAQSYRNSSYVQFGEGIHESDLHYSFEKVNASQYSDNYNFGTEQYALKVTIGNGADSLLLVGSEMANDLSGFVDLRFSDGTAVQVQEILGQLRVATDADQLIVGTSGSDVLAGGRGDDVLVGGGALYVSQPDEFVYNIGDGNDTIVGNVMTGSTITLGDGVDPDKVSVARSGTDNKDLILTFADTGETLKIQNQFSVSATIEYDADGNRTGHYETSNYIGTVRFANGVIWTATDLLERALAATDGNDHLVGSAADETLDGKAGDDVLAGGAGSDTYVFGMGSGHDTINESATSIPLPWAGDFQTMAEGLRDRDTLQFGTGISVSDLDIIVTGDDQGDLLIRIKSTGDSVFISQQVNDGGNWGDISAEAWNEFYGSAFGNEPLFAAGIEKFSFADGSVYDRKAFLELATQRDNGGNNTISTPEIGGTLDGGAGDDLLQGGGGNDQYVLGTGYGEDTVTDAGGSDYLRLSEGIDPRLVALTRTGENGNDLLIEVDGKDRLAVTIRDQFGDAAHRIEGLEFADGTQWSWTEIQSALLSQSISEGNDIIVGFSTPDIIRSRGGDDIINGGGGADRIDGGAGWDVAIFEGKQDRYQIEADGTTYIVEDRQAGGQQTILTNIEEIRFAGESAGSEDDHKIVLTGNAAPVAGDLSFEATEDTVLRLSSEQILARARDPDGGDVTLVSVGEAIGGTIKLGASGMVTFTPSAEYSGDASFSYTVRDASGLVSEGKAFVHISAQNDAPASSVSQLTVNTDEDQPINYALPAGMFSDVDNSSLVVTASMADGSALPGWLTFDPEALVLSGQPPENGFGNFELTIVASDGVASISVPLTLSVASVNDAPTLRSEIPNQTYATGEAVNFSVPVSTFSDADGDQLALVATLSNGKPLPNWLQFSAETGTFSGSIPPGAAGSYEVSVFATDGQAITHSTFAIEVSGQSNTAPILQSPLPDQIFNEDAPISFSIGEAAFSDADGDTLSLAAGLSDGAALPDWLHFDAATRTFSGQPPANFNGVLQLVVSASDGQASISGQFELNIRPVNDAPIAVSDVGSAKENEVKHFDLLANDSDPDDGETRTLTSVTVLSVTGVAGLTALAAQQAFHIEDNHLIFSPETQFDPLSAGQQATVIVQYDVTDASGVHATSTFTLTVDGEDDIPSNVHYGTPANDVLFGTSQNDVIDALDGNDVVFGNGGADILNGGGGNDQLFGGGGNDVLHGGSGNDAIYGNGGNDAISGDDGNDQLYGGSGNDNIDGGSGDDLIYGNGGSDVINAGDGNDLLCGGAASDVLKGGAGDDVIYGNGGNDAISGDSGNDRLFGGSGSDVIEGGSGNDLIYGNGGADALKGGAGDDQIFAGDAADTISGGDGDDVVFANGGNDIIEGAGGNDQLWGGSGADVFLFQSGFGHDIIHDFSLADVIEFASSVFENFDEVLDAATQVGNDTVIALDDDNSVTLQYVALASLSADEFRFVA